jgi:hypothetical protein
MHLIELNTAQIVLLIQHRESEEVAAGLPEDVKRTINTMLNEWYASEGQLSKEQEALVKAA